MSVPSNAAAKKWQETMLDIRKKSYWIVGLLILGFSAYFYYTGLKKPVAGVLWFFGGFLITYYYWVKWFVLPMPPDPDLVMTSGSCPDYLSVVPNNIGLYTPSTPTQYFCVDYVGVSRNGALKKMNPTQISTLISDPSYTFSVDPAKDFANESSKAAFIQRLIRAGLSFNSVGDSSTPANMGAGSNIPTFSGTTTVVPPTPSGLTPVSGVTGTFSLTGDQLINDFKEVMTFSKANNITGSNTTDAQNQLILNDLITKGLVPAGITIDQMKTAFTTAGANLTDAQKGQLVAMALSMAKPS
jgi:hypothetical protein